MAISENLTYVINHVFLPPKLPQKEDDYIPEKDNAIGEHCKSAIASFRDYLPDQRSKSKLKWAVCDRMIRNLLELRDPVEGAVSDKLGKYIAEMKIHGTYLRIILLHIESRFTLPKFQVGIKHPRLIVYSSSP